MPYQTLSDSGSDCKNANGTDKELGQENLSARWKRMRFKQKDWKGDSQAMERSRESVTRLVLRTSSTLAACPAWWKTLCILRRSAP